MKRRGKAAAQEAQDRRLAELKVIQMVRPGWTLEMMTKAPTASRKLLAEAISKNHLAEPFAWD